MNNLNILSFRKYEVLAVWQVQLWVLRTEGLGIRVACPHLMRRRNRWQETLQIVWGGRATYSSD